MTESSPAFRRLDQFAAEASEHLKARDAVIWGAMIGIAAHAMDGQVARELFEEVARDSTDASIAYRAREIVQATE